MPLESDTVAADANLDVLFYEYQGDNMFNGRIFVRIITPGNKLNIPDRVATEEDKRRFQHQWLHFQMKNSEGTSIGTPLLKWRTERPEEITQGQVEELHIMKFTTVEQVAMASDAQIARVGMGGAGLRNKARTYLASKNAQASSLAHQKQQDEIDMLKATLARLMEEKAKPAPAVEKTYRAGAARRGGKSRRSKPVRRSVAPAPAPVPAEA